jgi:hypothetical protein
MSKNKELLCCKRMIGYYQAKLKYQRLKTPPARRLDWIGCTSTSDIPNPTAKPMATEMSCSAVWNPDKKDVEEPDVCWDANVRRPPLPSPDGT